MNDGIKIPKIQPIQYTLMQVLLTRYLRRQKYASPHKFFSESKICLITVSIEWVITHCISLVWHRIFFIITRFSFSIVTIELLWRKLIFRSIKSKLRIWTNWIFYLYENKIYFIAFVRELHFIARVLYCYLLNDTKNINFGIKLTKKVGGHH